MSSITYVKYNKEFYLRLRELPLADQTGARCNLVPECFADLRWAREPLYTLYFMLCRPEMGTRAAEPATRDRPLYTLSFMSQPLETDHFILYTLY